MYHLRPLKAFLFAFLFSSIVVGPFQVTAQLLITTGGDPTILVNNVLLGSGVSAFNVTISGGSMSYGTFTTGSNPTNLGLTSGLILTCGDASLASGINDLSGAGYSANMPGDSLLTEWAGFPTFDANVLEFDFTPQGDTIQFRYVFGSEEYPEYVSGYNDIFGFFISGGPDPLTWLPYDNKNIALVPGTNLPVSIFNINNVTPSYPQYYVDNTNGLTIQYDGFTTILTAWCLVVPCMNYHMKLAIADAVDHILDSGVFLEEGSFSSGGIATNITYSNNIVPALNAIEGCNDAILTFKLPFIADDGYVIPYSILASSTATYGVDYDSIPSPLVILPGTDSVSLIIHAFADGIPEGPETVGLVVPKSICLTDYDTVFFTIIDYSFVSGATGFADTTIQCGDSVTLTSQLSNGMEPFFYAWSSGSTFDTAIVSPTITSLFYLTATDACGFTVFDSTLVQIYGPTAYAGPDTSICFGGTASLTASGGSTYLWSNGNTGATIAVSPLVTTDYIVTVTEVCSDVDTVRVIVHPLPAVIATTSADSICKGEAAHLFASGAQSYAWTSFPPDPSLAPQCTLPGPVVSPVTSVLYTLTGTDINTCVNSATVMVVMKPTPTANFLVSDHTLCVNETTIITYNGDAPPSSSFTWNFDGGDVVNGSGAGPYEVAWYDPGDHIISLLVNRQGCLSGVFKDTVMVIPKPHALFDADITSGCAPLEVNFFEYSTSVLPGTVYEWYFGNGDKTYVQHPTYTYNKSGTYTVTLVVSNQYGCNDTLKKTALIHVYPNPVASFSLHPQQVSIQDPQVKFYDSSFGQIATWLWDFGDGTTGDLPNMMHTFTDTGTFLISLNVVTLHGCTDSAFREIVVTPDNTIYIPNSFTPNNDNNNDVFRVFGTNIHDFRMEIFNRWGELIFSSHDIDQGWDGTYKGDIVKTGVYPLIIKYKDAVGSKHSYYGRITLLR